MMLASVLVLRICIPPELTRAQRHERMLGQYARPVEETYPSALVDGFELGMFVSYDDCGDAWVKAPDGSVAGLIWETAEPVSFKVSIEPNDARWGTYAVQLPLPLTSDDEAAAYLAALLPDLRPRWLEWRRRRDASADV